MKMSSSRQIQVTKGLGSFILLMEIF
jgi:hypothetical protein